MNPFKVKRFFPIKSHLRIQDTSNAKKILILNLVRHGKITPCISMDISRSRRKS